MTTELTANVPVESTTSPELTIPTTVDPLIVESSPMSSVTTSIIEKLNSLPKEQQQSVLDFVEFLAQKHTPHKPIWEKIRERVAQVPEELWDELPTDGSTQHDHYLYGTPKREV